jgi:hypothetical protein
MSKDFPPTKPIDRHANDRIKRPPADDRIKLYATDARDEQPVLNSVRILDPRDLGLLFVRKSHLFGEDQAAYDALLSKVWAALAPRDYIEGIWVMEFVDCIFDGQFYRRVRHSYLTEALRDAVQRFLDLDDDVIDRWAAGDKAASAAIEKALKEEGLVWDAVRNQVLLDKLDKLEQLDGLIGSTDARRDKALHKLERRRERGVQPLPPVIEGLRTVDPEMVRGWSTYVFVQTNVRQSRQCSAQHGAAVCRGQGAIASECVQAWSGHSGGSIAGTGARHHCARSEAGRRSIRRPCDTAGCDAGGGSGS